jgi:4'-phosphopantetheinyl transferase
VLLAAPPDSAAEEGTLLRRHGIEARRIRAPFPIWLVRGHTAPGDSALERLSPEERARADRFRLPQHRDRYLAGHAALRLLGDLYFGIPAARQRYARNAHGKPRLAGHRRAECSISYSGDLAAVAWAWGEEIGIDIERLRPIDDAVELAELHFTLAEQARLARLEPASIACARAFLTVWVRKEACVKALGRGLSIPTDSFECGTAAGDAVVAVEGERIESEVLSVGNDLIVAWARRRSSERAETPIKPGSPRRWTIPAADLHE